MKFLTRFFIVWVLVIFLILGIYFYKYRPSIGSISFPKSTTIPTPTLVPTLTPGNFYSVTKVIDGDTVDVSVDNKIQKIRLIGIDAPEITKSQNANTCFGQESSQELKTLLIGKKISLQSDPSQTDTDKYGRLLRYVYLEDGTFINEILIKNGYAREYTYDKPYQYRQQFLADQTQAENNRLGLWAVCH